VLWLTLPPPKVSQTREAESKAGGPASLPTGPGGQLSEWPSERRAQPSPPGEASGDWSTDEPAPAGGGTKIKHPREHYKFFLREPWIVFGKTIETVRRELEFGSHS